MFCCSECRGYHVLWSQLNSNKYCYGSFTHLPILSSGSRHIIQDLTSSTALPSHRIRISSTAVRCLHIVRGPRVVDDRFHRSVINISSITKPPSASTTVTIRSPSSLIIVTHHQHHRRRSPSTLTSTSYHQRSRQDSLTCSSTCFCSFYASTAYAFYCSERAVGPQTTKEGWGYSTQ